MSYGKGKKVLRHALLSFRDPPSGETWKDEACKSKGGPSFNLSINDQFGVRPINNSAFGLKGS